MRAIPHGPTHPAWVPLLAAAASTRVSPAGISMTAAATESIKTADKLLAEVAKTERSLTVIASLVKMLEEESELPSTAGKQKRALAGSWKVEYASNEAAIAPFLTGPAGPFEVVEGVVHCIKESGEFSSIEVKRRVGPFGNSKQTLGGRWSLVAPDSGGIGSRADGKPRMQMRWKASYMIDARGREVDPPRSAGVHEARVAHASPQLLLLRIPPDSTDAAGLLVFSKVTLKAALEDLKVAEDE